jgi:hypothetical protein
VIGEEIIERDDVFLSIWIFDQESLLNVGRPLIPRAHAENRIADIVPNDDLDLFQEDALLTKWDSG